VIDGPSIADQKIAERKADAARRKAERRRERAQLAARRTAGLRLRHLRKLSRLRNQEDR
jgi:hypothetical protein